MQRHIRTGAAVVATVIGLVGCGGGSSSDQTAKFKTSFRAAITQLRQISKEIGTTIEQASSQTDAQLAASFRGLAGRWQDQLSQLQTLKAPASVAPPFNTLTAAATRVETDLNAIAAAAGTHSKSAATQASASIVTDILSAKAASTAITTKLGIK